jgi:hypothetical protein
MLVVLVCAGSLLAGFATASGVLPGGIRQAGAQPAASARPAPAPAPGGPAVEAEVEDEAKPDAEAEGQPAPGDAGDRERLEGVARLASAAQPTGHTFDTTSVRTNVRGREQVLRARKQDWLRKLFGRQSSISLAHIRPPLILWGARLSRVH